MNRRKVSTLGVQYRDQFYTHQQLASHIGKNLTIEPLPDMPARLAVYDRRGELVCEVYRQGELPPEIVAAILLERGQLRAQDRKWWRRLLTEIEVDARERRTAVQSEADEAAGGSLVEALFGRLPLNQPAHPPSPDQAPQKVADVDDAGPADRQRRESDESSRTGGTNQQRKRIGLNQPAPASGGVAAGRLEEAADA